MTIEDAIKKGTLKFEGSANDKTFFVDHVLKYTIGPPALFSQEGQVSNGQLALLQSLQDCLSLVFKYELSSAWFFGSHLNSNLWIKTSESPSIIPFGQQDVIALEAIVKSMNVISNAKVQIKISFFFFCFLNF